MSDPFPVPFPREPNLLGIGSNDPSSARVRHVQHPGERLSLLVQQDVSGLEHGVREQAHGSIVLLLGGFCLWG